MRDRETGNDSTQCMGSVAGIHKPTGLNLMLAGGAQDGGGSYVYLKGGITRDGLIALGATSLAADYSSGSDVARGGSDSAHRGLHVAQRIDDQNLDVYAGYRVYEFSDRTGTRYADANSLLAGLRWRF